MSGRLIQTRLREETIHRVEDIAIIIDAENHTEALATSIAAFHPIIKSLHKQEMSKIGVKAENGISGTVFVIPSQKIAERVEKILKIAKFFRII